MDYAIYKTTDGKQPRVIHRFTQAACNHRAKAAARKKLTSMGWRIIQRSQVCYNFQARSKDEFEYDYYCGVGKTEKIRFYIDKI